MIVNTTATWKNDHFILHTPNADAEKVWISQGLMARWGLVIAQLQVEGKDLGPHAFLIDMELPGVSKINMQPKTAFNALDNACITFSQVRLEASAMLGRYSRMQNGAYVLTTGQPFKFYQLAQRLLSGRICIAGASLSALMSMKERVEAYMEMRHVVTAPGTKAPLRKLPYIAQTLAVMDSEAWVHRAFVDLCEREFAAVIEGDKAVPNSLVDRIASAKIEAIEFATVSALRLRQLVGAYGLMADSPFGQSDIFLCMRFAEGDTRVLQQKMARDILKQAASPLALLGLIFHCVLGSAARLLGLMSNNALLKLKRDSLLLRMAWRLLGVRKEKMPEVWLALAESPYRLAHLHAVWVIHSAVVAAYGNGKETSLFFNRNYHDG